MGDFVKTIKVIRLKNDTHGVYLTACDDQASVTLSTLNRDGSIPKGADWKIMWTKEPSGYINEAYLVSIYDKVLSIDSSESCLCGKPTALCQLPWAIAKETPAWRFELKKSRNTLFGCLVKGCKLGHYMALTVSDAEKSLMCKFVAYWREATWLTRWLVEIVEISREKNDNMMSAHLMHSSTAVVVAPTQRQIVQPQEYFPAAPKSVVGGKLDKALYKISQLHVGQFVIKYGNGGGAGAKDLPPSWYSSGGNVNGSGNQTVGNVSVDNGIVRCRDNNVTYVDQA